MNIEFNYNINPTWELIETVEQNTKELFKVQDEELKNATLMVVSELLENAVKYGKSDPEINGIEFKFSADDKKINVQVTNAVTDAFHADQVIKNINKVNAADNPEILYTNRLKELLENRKNGESKLGLYRIVYEGKFGLSYRFTNNILTVTAERVYQ